MTSSVHHHHRFRSERMASLNLQVRITSTLFLGVLLNGVSGAVVPFVFGDSLTEVGNNNFLQYSLAKSNYPWYGIDYKNGRPTGRFSNGRTIGDVIFSKLGVSSPPPYLSLLPLSTNDAFLQGVNYASGGAGILNETGIYFIEKLSFDDQIGCFEKTKKAIIEKIGEEASSKLIQAAVFYVGLGSNDYINNFLQPFLPDGQQYTHEEFLDLIASTLEGQLKRLHGLGVRNIVFNGLGPLGCIPSQRVKSRNGTCLNNVNQWVVDFNSRVKTLLVSLNSSLPSAHFGFADSYHIVMDLIKRPQNYGLKVGNASCCNVDKKLGGLCLPNSNLCSNRSEYVFWDAFHPSDAANVVIADIMISSDSGFMPASLPGFSKNESIW